MKDTLQSWRNQLQSPFKFFHCWVDLWQFIFSTPIFFSNTIYISLFPAAILLQTTKFFLGSCYCLLTLTVTKCPRLAWRRPIMFNCLQDAGQTEKQNSARNPDEVLKGSWYRLWPPCWVSLKVENSFTLNTLLQPGSCKTFYFFYPRSMCLIIEMTATSAELYP